MVRLTDRPDMTLDVYREHKTTTTTTNLQRVQLLKKRSLLTKEIFFPLRVDPIYSLTTNKQTTKFSSANFQKNIKSKLNHIENSKTRGQTV